MNKKLQLVLTFLILFNAVVYPQWRKVLEGTFPYNPSLKDIAYVNEDTVYIASAKGIILKTVNGGTTWDKIETGTDADLYAVQKLNDSIFYAVGKNRIFLRSIDGGNTFLKDTISQAELDLIKVYFSDINNGYILSNAAENIEKAGKLLKTTDGGLNWSVVIEEGLCNLYNMHFISNNTGVVVGGGASTLALYYTKDGTTFIKSPAPSLGGYGYTKANINAVQMVNNNIVYASGWGSMASSLQPTIHLKSTNGGESWTYLEQNSNKTYETINSITFKNENEGLAVGGSKSALILKTTDGGINWIRVAKPLGCILYDVTSYNDKVWIVGDGGVIASSSDFFNTFQLKNPFPSVPLYTMQWVNENTAFAMGVQGIIFKTTDKGNTWKYSFLFANNISLEVNSIHFVNENLGYSAHNYKLAAKTTDGGETWSAIIPDVQTKDAICTNVFFIDENIGFIVGRDNLSSDFIYKTTDGGLTFLIKNNITNKEIRSIHFMDNNGAVVGQSKTGAYTTDFGETWNISTFSGSTIKNHFDDVKFLTKDIVLAAGMSNMLYKSVDGGKTYNYIPTIFSGVNFNNISCSNTDSVYLSGWYNNNSIRKNYLLLSTDLGNSWENIIDTNVVQSNYFVQGSTNDYDGKSWLYGTYSSIFTNADIVSIFENEINNTSFNLSQNYPNPFNPITTINFNLAKASNVELVVYDMLGNKVKELINDYREAGDHKIRFNASDLSSGIYFYTIKANGFLQTKKMNLIK